MTKVTTTTTKADFAPEKIECILPYTYSEKNGALMSSDILTLIKGGKNFKINLYPQSMKPSCRGHPDGKDLPQKNESYYYSAQPVGSRYYFYGPLRKYNKENGQFDTCGAYRTRWYIDSSDWSLNQADYGNFFKWRKEEYRILLEPYERAWNRAVIDVDADGPIHINDSLTPSQFKAFRARINDQEKMDTALLKRKHENQQKKERAKTPSPTFKKKRRHKILARTSMQRMFSTAKLKHPSKIVFITTGNFFCTFANDALKIAKHTDLHITYDVNEWVPPTVEFPKHKIDFYTAVCHQKGMKVVIV